MYVRIAPEIEASAALVSKSESWFSAEENLEPRLFLYQERVANRTRYFKASENLFRKLIN